MTKLQILLFTFLIVFLAACGGEEPTPEPTATPQPPPTFTAMAQPAPTETPISSEAATVSESPLAPVDAASTAPESLQVASPQVESPQIESPLAVAASASCPIQPYIDLSGYPDLINLPTVLGCPLAEAALDPVAINEFGGGPDYDRFMLWFGSEEQIYVLFANQTWLSYTDTWNDREPEITCNPDNLPMTSPPLPRRGFGKLWCTVENVQKELGMIDREERLCQHSVTQRFEKGRLLACFEDATIRYFRVLNDGRWDMMLVK